jgi:chromate transporter
MREDLTPLLELAALFLRLGVTAFGGPAAHVALMENEVVRRRKWMSSERFTDLFGAANLIPGPSSSELAIYIGYERVGMAGLLVAGTCFILPAALLTGSLAWAYVRFGALPATGNVLYGIKPVVIAIVGQALLALGPKAVKTRALGAVSVGALAACAAGVDAIVVLLGAGCVVVASRPRARRGGEDATLQAAFLGPLLTPAAAAPLTLLGLFGFFLKAGVSVFGSGYVLLAFLRTDLVDRWHWLTESQLLDAVAVGQVTPGPVFTTATFIGYVLAGAPGAVLATVGIFLPGFLLVGFSRPILARARRSATAGAFLDGVNVGSLALMAGVTFQLARASLVDVMTVAIALAAAVLLYVWNLNSAWLILGGAAIGAISRWR